MTQHESVFTPEQCAILEVIEADLASYLARDKEAWEDNWVQSEAFNSIMECGTLQIANGYSAFRANMLEAMKAEPDQIRAATRQENVQVHIRGDMAWAVFDQIVTDTENPLAPPNLSHNLRLFERDSGRWRIVFHGVWSQPQRDAKIPTVEVNSDCAVVWMNQHAATALASFAGLTISQGILRASRPAWNTDLSDQIRRAHSLKSFARYNLAAAEGGGSVTYPVVLGEDQDGTQLICWVKVSDGRVYVLFGESADLYRQIEAAQVIYGLSQTQAEVVKLVASGHGISQTADALGVSANTVKTQLKRTFEKVGVGSQIDLIRRLVSFSV